MTLIQIIVLSLIQGLTEFLPVSSSAHLILGSKVFSWPDQGLVFDVATHLGTLFAALVYFRKEIWQMVVPWLGRGRGDEASRKLGITLVLASIPAILAGGLLHGWVEDVLRDVRIIAFATIGFGLLLWWADARFTRSRDGRYEPQGGLYDRAGANAGAGAGHFALRDYHYHGTNARF